MLAGLRSGHWPPECVKEIVMTHRTVREVMTAKVVTVTEGATFKELATVLSEHRISAVPVLDGQGHVIGLVSEIDLLRKEEYQDDRSAPALPRWGHRDDRSRAAGLTAADVMTSPVLTIRQDASVVEAARALDRSHVRRLVVTDDNGQLAGIITPIDLLRTYLRSDQEILDEIVGEVITSYLGTDPARVEVAVASGVVSLSGEVEKKSMIPLAARMARAVDGVVDVRERLSYGINDDRVPPAGNAGY
jgi:CBS domain-containing protein